ncbi:uncharacterized protein BDR25DRAFT_359042 [Lindgomyces ingoldianus]|uniref:Uncharacterized protein n=1 Tax=Lindgomyces ingoldianus TaxID=673940 RepID=A0ACB6QJC9_9PLEO|nr:uncharacterized protein BDR25DRAFT_359042 [Lindgomyces ingoldianus]KAF2466991.1 hypothetical protein BDR25DRAFT_359042 [Lindgomyces ingoldianus]
MVHIQMELTLIGHDVSLFHTLQTLHFSHATPLHSMQLDMQSLPVLSIGIKRHRSIWEHLTFYIDTRCYAVPTTTSSPERRDSYLAITVFVDKCNKVLTLGTPRHHPCLTRSGNHANKSGDNPSCRPTPLVSRLGLLLFPIRLDGFDSLTIAQLESLLLQIYPLLDSGCWKDAELSLDHWRGSGASRPNDCNALVIFATSPWCRHVWGLREIVRALICSACVMLGTFKLETFLCRERHQPRHGKVSKRGSWGKEEQWRFFKVNFEQDFVSVSPEARLFLFTINLPSRALHRYINPSYFNYFLDF